MKRTTVAVANNDWHDTVIRQGQPIGDYIRGQTKNKKTAGANQSDKLSSANCDSVRNA